MDFARRLVTRLPVDELWNSQGIVRAHRVRNLDETELTRHLQDGSTFVVADLGQPLRWIRTEDRFEFWKSDVKSRLAAPNSPAYLNDYPGAYCYFASLWELSNSVPMIVLERHH
jgi:hypothetical protein